MPGKDNSKLIELDKLLIEIRDKMKVYNYEVTEFEEYTQIRFNGCKYKIPNKIFPLIKP